MKPVKTLYAAAAFSLAALGATAAQAAGVEVLNEGFSDVSGLTGWAQVNDSIPVGNGWFQGNGAVFPAQAGAADAYAAVNYLSAAAPGGTVDNWLFTPVLDLSGTTVLSFYTRASTDPGFADQLEVRFYAGTGTDTADYTTLLTVGGSADGYPTDWQQLTASVTSEGSGRFAFRYVGLTDTLSYIGVDTVSVVTAVPEPATWTMLALGLGLLPILRRQARR